MTPFILASFWTYFPSNPDGFTLPKIAVIAAGMIAYLLRKQPRALAFVVVCGVSAYRSAYPEWSFYGFPHFWAYGFLAAVAYCLLLTMPTGKWNWLKWGAVAMSIHAVLQKFGLDPLLPVTKLLYGRAVAYEGSPVDLGAILAMAAPVAGPWVLVIALGMWAANSRAAALAAAFAMAPRKLRLLMLPLLFAPLFFQSPKDIARVEMLKTAWAGFREAPILGSGINTFAVVFTRLKTKRLLAAVGDGYLQQQAHNDIAEALCCLGLVGLAAYLLLIWPLLRSPSLMALFIFMKYDAVAFEVLACAALIGANMIAEDETDERNRLSLG